MQLAWKVEAGNQVKLKDYDPDYVDEHTDPTSASAELENHTAIGGFGSVCQKPLTRKTYAPSARRTKQLGSL